ncbi:class I SAM-dependent methyltransferase [Rhodoluna limnophila]|uniref:class I SAM-dependent methyltransferase n=1 Tax=Rhodoluna limnophila TaxID=232537 RepID=UPI0011062343|nr:class I SAM-dependent methyltransferase [Rhodoluna limnophila]
MATKKPIGTITRGTTNPNRLRRIDRFIAAMPLLRKTAAPIVVDLGFGASPITAIELLARLTKVNSNAHVVGIEIDRERVERGLAVAHSHLHFTHGGFETPLPPELSQKADVIRAFNVLRQYDESEVRAAWQLMASRLSTIGRLVEGTCDEIGRLASWVTLDSNGPLTFTISLRLQGLELPSKVAERLPKALIHHNLPGEKIYDFLQALDRAWLINAGLSAFSPAQRWLATCQTLETQGWQIHTDKKRRRLGELTIDWSAVAPEGF